MNKVKNTTIIVSKNTNNKIIEKKPEKIKLSKNPIEVFYRNY